MKASVVPGTYTHYKGGKYLVLFEVKDSTNTREGNRVVVYVSLTNGNVYCRDEKEFMEKVKWHDGKMRSRFLRDKKQHHV